MVKTLLANDIQINMDVVYNHTAESDATNFEKIIPGIITVWTATSATQTVPAAATKATDHYMYRKFVVDSCKFWLGEYKLSGFRFDLMGLIDTGTMEEVYAECAKIYDKVMIYGEPWTGGTTTLSSLEQTNQSTVGGLTGTVGAFNDKIRNGIKGDNTPGTGWVQGNKSSAYPGSKRTDGTFLRFDRPEQSHQLRVLSR